MLIQSWGGLDLLEPTISNSFSKSKGSVHLFFQKRKDGYRFDDLGDGDGFKSGIC
jgi:hypothetical protein